MEKLLPIITLFLIIYLIYCQNNKKENFTDNLNNNKVQINDSIKNVGIIVNQILKKDNLVLPSNIFVPNAENIITDKEFKIGNRVMLNNDPYLPNGTITAYYSDNLFIKEFVNNDPVFSFNIPDGWVLCDGMYYKKYKYLKPGDKVFPLSESVYRGLTTNQKKLYFKTVDLMDRMIIGCSIPGQQIENNNYNFGSESISIKPSMDNKIYSKGGENEIIINDNNIPKHNHFITSYPIKNNPRNTSKDKKYLSSVRYIGHKVDYILPLYDKSKPVTSDNMVGHSSSQNLSGEVDETYRQSKYNNLPANIKLVWIQKY